MKTVTLTEKLAERAEAKLTHDFNVLKTFLNNNPIATRMMLVVKSGENIRRDSLDRIVNYSSVEKKSVFEEMLPEYIERETNEFIAKVESLSSEVDDLKNQLNY